MKTTKIALIALTMSVVSALNTQGQNTPQPPTSTEPSPTTSPTTMVQQPLPMLISRQALKTYVEEQAATVLSAINTVFPSDNQNYGFVEVKEKTAAGIIDAIHGVSMSVDVVNWLDPLYLQASAFDKDGVQLLSGFSQFYLVPNPYGGYSMPKDYENVKLKMCKNPPVTIPGAQSAFVDVLGDNGETIAQHSLQVGENGKVFYPEQLAGENAILVVYSNNQWLYWNIRSGMPIQPTEFVGLRLNPSIEGVVTMTDSDVLVAVPTSNRNGTNLTAELKVTKTGQNPEVSFWTTEGSWFQNAMVRKAGESEWVLYTPVLNRDRGLISFRLELPAIGTYFIIPTWENGDLVEPYDPYVPPVYPHPWEG